MKKNIRYILAMVGISTVMFGACKKSLDLNPISNLSDASYWKTPDQYDAFVSGLHSRFRAHNANFEYLGEMRSGIYGTDPGTTAAFTGEATQGLERMWQHTLDTDNPGVSNFGGFYDNINQLNLLIEKLNTSTVLTEVVKNNYLGIAYGMRAFYYFQLYRTWGQVIIQTEPTVTLDVANLAKAASSEAEVMALIKADIDVSNTNFGTDYSFSTKVKKGYWSKSATQMLKAEVYLWTAHRSGGPADATIAKTALTEIQANVAGLNLLPSYADLFAAANKNNAEIIFASRNQLNEAALGFISNFVPQTGLIINFSDSLTNRKFDVTTDNYGGLLRAPTRIATYRQFSNADTRKNVTIQAAYSKTNDTYSIAGAFLRKYQGEQNAGTRAYTNDFPIYRYADLLLLLAEAKVELGESPATEINLVRARAYGSNYNEASLGFPNQAVDADPREALLQERLFEFIGEGKRWYDLRRMGDKYVFEKTGLSSSQAYKLLWPIDRLTLTNNRSLVQTAGYPGF
jgi:hypothetical protein